MSRPSPSLTEPPSHEDVTLVEDSAPLFVRQGGDYLPLQIAHSPWHDASVNGAAIAGLLAMETEHATAPTGLVPVRMTFDILGRVPASRFSTIGHWQRPGRRIGIFVNELEAEGKVVARATTLLSRETHSPAFDAPHGKPLPGEIPTSHLFSRTPFGRRIETRRLFGQPHQPGDGALWAKVNIRIVEDEPLSALSRTAILADTGSGIGNRLDRADWDYPNLDIGVNFARMPRGEWIMIEGSTTMTGNGHGLARSTLADEAGIFAYGFQTLFVSSKN